MKRKFFEPYILNEMNHYKLTYEEIYNILINESNQNIINESVYRKEWFQELFNFIQQSSIDIIPLNRQELMEYFSLKSRPFKILSKSLEKYQNIQMYNIIILKADFSDKNNIKEMILNIYEHKENNLDIDIDKIYENLQISDAVFMPSNNKSNIYRFKPSLLWLNKNTITLEYFMHEFIHYLEWIDDYYLSGNIEDKLYISDMTIMNQYCNLFQLTSNNLEYIFSKNEYQTLLNDFLNNLDNLKNKVFNNYNGNQFARYICFNLTKDNESNIEYLNKIQKFLYFNELNIDFSFAMIVGYNLINFKIMNIRNHIFGKFH